VSRYEAWLLLHIASASVWAGGALTLGIVTLSAERFRTPVELALLARVNAWIGPHVLTPASLMALASGLLLVADGPWSFGQLWIVLGLVGFALTFLAGQLFLGPESKRIREAVQRSGADSPEVAARVRRVLLVSRAATLLLFFVLADMVLKPTADDVWLLVLGGAAFAALLATLVWLARTPARAPASGTPAATLR
jgi:uncharacterized membrane protein